MKVESLITVANQGKLLSLHLQMLAACNDDLEVRKKLKIDILRNLKTISASLNDAIKYVENG